MTLVRKLPMLYNLHQSHVWKDSESLVCLKKASKQHYGCKSPPPYWIKKSFKAKSYLAVMILVPGLGSKKAKMSYITLILYEKQVTLQSWIKGWYIKRCQVKENQIKIMKEINKINPFLIQFTSHE